MSVDERGLIKVKSWMKENDILDGIDDNILLRFLHIYDGDVERAIALLLVNMKIRKLNPHIFSKRSFNTLDVQNAMKVTRCFSMPRNTAKNYRITIFKLGDRDPSLYNFDHVAKFVFMTFDSRFTMPEYDTDGEISILDASGFSFRHLLKIKLATLKLYLKYIQEAAPMRIVENHFINCSPIIDKVMMIAKPFIKKELYDVIHFHKPNSETLFNHISKDDLPSDLGGNLETTEKLHSDWLVKLQRKSNYLLQDKMWGFNN